MQQELVYFYGQLFQFGNLLMEGIYLMGFILMEMVKKQGLNISKILFFIISFFFEKI